ncbi:TM2 domain-containing protein [Campylobacter sp. MIT 99-7217]|uniref:NINE protein n=1 Tax=Campylobacter sp. MIT 99-7217 TaxID=535091 RepID=UPI001156EEA8|nr:TM2 domain-containing protein [Campylobacter sp. MIT 99-7217]TQR32463.1 TM2 domain-containing protein [Campylobacter sp. MIT 99-7217]
MDANAVLMTIQDKIPAQSLPMLQEKLKNASEDKLQNISLVPLKSSIIGLILGIFFGGFGIDRFYKGDIGLGIAKLALCVIGWLTAVIYIGLLLLLIVWVWTVVDYFLVFKGIKQDNLNKILAIL